MEYSTRSTFQNHDDHGSTRSHPLHSWPFQRAARCGTHFTIRGSLLRCKNGSNAVVTLRVPAGQRECKPGTRALGTVYPTLARQPTTRRNVPCRLQSMVTLASSAPKTLPLYAMPALFTRTSNTPPALSTAATKDAILGRPHTTASTRYHLQASIHRCCSLFMTGQPSRKLLGTTPVAGVAAHIGSSEVCQLTHRAK